MACIDSPVILIVDGRVITGVLRKKGFGYCLIQISQTIAPSYWQLLRGGGPTRTPGPISRRLIFGRPDKKCRLWLTVCQSVIFQKADVEKFIYGYDSWRMGDLVTQFGEPKARLTFSDARGELVRYRLTNAVNLEDLQLTGCEEDDPTIHVIGHNELMANLNVAYRICVSPVKDPARPSWLQGVRSGQDLRHAIILYLADLASLPRDNHVGPSGLENLNLADFGRVTAEMSAVNSCGFFHALPVRYQPLVDIYSHQSPRPSQRVQVRAQAGFAHIIG
jgi:hypothetical protein